MLLPLIEVCGHLFMHSCLKVPPQHLVVVEVWTLTGSLQNIDYFSFQPFCCKFAAVFGITDLLHDPILACVGQMASHLKRLQVAQAMWMPSTTAPHSWYEVLVLICCDWLFSNVALCSHFRSQKCSGLFRCHLNKHNQILI